MPVYENDQPKAIYYNLRSFNEKDSDIKNWALTRYNSEKKGQEFVGAVIEGTLMSVNIWKPNTYQKNDGKSFTIQIVSMEFHTIDKNGNLVREVVKMKKDSAVYMAVVQKLYSATDFRLIKIKCSKYKNKNNEWKDTIYMYQGVDRDLLPKRINFRYKEGSGYEQPANLVELPSIEYRELADGTKEVDPNWKIKQKEIYDKAINDISKAVQAFRNTDPEIIKLHVEGSTIDSQKQKNSSSNSIVEDIPTDQTFEADDIEINMPF